MDKRLEALLDREAIRDVVDRYARAADRGDVELMESVYWPEAVNQHGSQAVGVSDFVSNMMPLMDRNISQCIHATHNVYIDLQGDLAYVESYSTSYHRIPPDRAVAEEMLGPEYVAEYSSQAPDGYDFFNVSRYIDKVEKRGDEWRIIHRQTTREFHLRSPARDWPNGVSTWVPIQGTRDRSDLSYAR